MTLTFDAGRHIKHERIVEAVEPRLGRWTPHVIIEASPLAKLALLALNKRKYFALKEFECFCRKVIIKCS